MLIENGAFATFAVCSALLVLKMIVVGHYTAFVRMQRGVFLNPEDADAFRQPDGKAGAEHPDVERGLRAHRNDLESTLPFFAVGLIYLLIDPSVGLAKTLFIAFTVCRIIFSVFYFGGVQPWRSLTFIVAELCQVVMIVQILWWGIAG